MRMRMNNRFSGPVTVFHGYALPQEAISAGYAPPIDAYNLVAPFPYIKIAIGFKHKVIQMGSWHLLIEDRLIQYIE